MWEAKKETTVSIDMNVPSQLMEIVGTESTEVADLDERAAVIEVIKNSKTAMLQVWWSNDKSGKGIDPPADGVESLEAYIGSDGDADTSSTTKTETTSTTSSETSTSTDETQEVVYGDANCDGDVSLADAVLIMQSLANPSRFGLTGSDEGHITEQGRANADCSNVGDGISNLDALAVQKYCLKLIPTLPE